MVGLMGGVVDGRQNILAFKKGIILQDLVNRSTGAQKLQYVGDAQALAADARTATALAFLHGDPAETLQFHKCTLDSKYAAFVAKASSGLSGPLKCHPVI